MDIAAPSPHRNSLYHLLLLVDALRLASTGRSSTVVFQSANRSLTAICIVIQLTTPNIAYRGLAAAVGVGSMKSNPSRSFPMAGWMPAVVMPPVQRNGSPGPLTVNSSPVGPRNLYMISVSMERRFALLGTTKSTAVTSDMLFRSRSWFAHSTFLEHGKILRCSLVMISLGTQVALLPVRLKQS